MFLTLLERSHVQLPRQFILFSQTKVIVIQWKSFLVHTQYKIHFLFTQARTRPVYMNVTWCSALFVLMKMISEAAPKHSSERRSFSFESAHLKNSCVRLDRALVTCSRQRALWMKQPCVSTSWLSWACRTAFSSVTRLRAWAGEASSSLEYGLRHASGQHKH